MKLLSVVGTRPNFMKLAAVARALAGREGVAHVIVHTGQHYDASMSASFFESLQLPAPQHHLSVGSGTPASQMAAIASRLETVLLKEAPDWVLAYGDVTSTLAAALTASQTGRRVAHVEAGLRSHDRAMPEELNRVVTDHIADLLFAPSRDAVDNLRAEGVPASRIRFVGNVMIDTLICMLPDARRSTALRDWGVEEKAYMLATLHRPSNVDEPVTLRGLMGALEDLSADLPVLFAVHPRTRQRLDDLGYRPPARADLRLVPPLAYTDMLALVAAARAVVTDSGGLQEETSALGVPCLTVRHNTERPVTCWYGTNRLVAPTRAALTQAGREALTAVPGRATSIELWDGLAGVRIADVLCGAEVVQAEEAEVLAAAT